MEEIDFERRREMRRQKREEMRLESESVTETVSSSYGGGSGGGDDEDQALQERMAKREERRQRRMMEAMERQKQLDAESNNSVSMEKNDAEEERPSSWRRGRYRDHEDEEEEEKTERYSSRREKEREEPRMEDEAAPEVEEQVDEGVEEEEEQQEEVEEEKPRSYMRDKEPTEGPKNETKDLAEDETQSVVSEISNQAKCTNSEAEEDAEASEEAGEVPEDDYVDYSSENKSVALRNESEEDNEVSEILHSEDNEVEERGRARDEQRKQNGGLHEEATPNQHRKPERTFSRGSVRSPEVSTSDDQDDAARLEAELKLEELKRRRDDAESEEFERMRQKQQEAEVELEELKRKREERKKVLDEEERQRKQEEEERKAREEEEKRKMKEEIERRRAEAAEKRQKVEDTMDGEGGPFKCVSPRGSSLKIGERAEFLNKSAQKSTMKAAHSPVVSKIDNRLEQYTSAAQRENKESRSPRSGAVDMPLGTDSIRNIKSMWEKGNVFSSPGGGGGTFKEAAVMKTGVAGRINDWLNKTPESGKTSGGRPADLKPVDVTNKRSLWENKGASPTKVAGRGETKSVANGMGH
ncbi:caldesmon 1a isoform X3 [Notolabrus celidotus]|uniref:caldesmon 1a isoform X3 n=1 Tax=Notolabrus celidotus TaxID=1203425 RepID=UPI0014904F95|nr:caldesmon 1a isoform X3 [Notolabrus celidotus]